MRINYVLIDYENVQPAEISLLDADHFKIIVFVGEKQKIPVEFAQQIQSMGTRASYLQIAGNGHNALDFHIAYYIGQLAAKDPDAYFHIISKDTGFDPLIQHLKSKKISAARSSKVSDMPCMKISNAKEPEDKLTLIVANLQQRGTSKPRTMKTLASTINSIFNKQLSEKELDALLKDLLEKGYVCVDGNRVSYAFPPKKL